MWSTYYSEYKNLIYTKNSCKFCKLLENGVADEVGEGEPIIEIPIPMIIYVFGTPVVLRIVKILWTVAIGIAIY